MAEQIKRNYSTDWAKFSIDSEEELSLLPTTSRNGLGNLANVPPAKAGSIAYTTDGELTIYTLDGSDNWNKR